MYFNIFYKPCGAFDCVLLVFTLSAIPPHQAATVLRQVQQALKPGGRLLFRDYGVYDMRHFKLLRGIKPTKVSFITDISQHSSSQCYA